MKIGELAKLTGLTAHTIRFYEAAGLSPKPSRTPSGYRSYTEADVARLTFILKAKRVGLSLDEVKGILQLHDLRQPTCVHVRSLLQDKLDQVNRAIQDLQDFKYELVQLECQARDLIDCRPMGGHICSIIERSGLEFPEEALRWVREPAAQR